MLLKFFHPAFLYSNLSENVGEMFGVLLLDGRLPGDLL
jgi:hypothetical protein